MKFIEVTGTQEVAPKALDFTGSPGKVYIRKNIRKITETVGEEEIEVYKYDEALVSYEEYEDYAAEQSSLDGDMQAEMLLNQMDILAKQEEQDDTLAEILLATVEA